MDFRVRRYKKEYDYSYTLGLAPTIELIENKIEQIYKIYIHPDYVQRDDEVNIYEICKKNDLEYVVNKNIFNRVSNKGNVYVLGVFYKYENKLNNKSPHVLLVNPSNAGNLGTILRTALGFDFKNLAIITPAVDIYNPNTIRSSMGALFSMNFKFYSSIDDYLKEFPEYSLYPFMLNGEYTIKNVPMPQNSNFTLVFGNEATGLPNNFLNLGKSVVINHSNKIDSLNLSISFGIAANHFSKYK